MYLWENQNQTATLKSSSRWIKNNFFGYSIPYKVSYHSNEKKVKRTLLEITGT
jgi:hypothetical protein